VHVHGILRREAHFASIHRRAKAHALLGDAPQALQAEHLEATRIGEDRAPPVHEAVQTTVRVDDARARPQEQVQRVAEDHLRAEPLQFLRRHRLDGAVGPDRHERRGLDDPMGGHQPPGARRSIDCLDAEDRIHCLERVSSIASP
jgi:hypothetical protein